MTAPISHQHRRRRCQQQSGFTLIELLLVVVILGILSAVVVFAVRGAGDKGQQAADDTDKRTLRTAQEAFCATYGRYAENEAQLVNPSLADPSFSTKGFLSEESTTHDIAPAGENDPKPCNRTGYVIKEVRDALPPVVDPDCLPGKWCPAISPDISLDSLDWGENQLVQLPDGKVLARGSDSFQVYDPTIGRTGGWAPPGPNPDRAHLADMVLVEGDSSVCGELCGKVLAVGSAKSQPTEQLWYVFDPAAPGWTLIGREADWYLGLSLTQLKGSKCGADCGKILIATPDPDRQGRPPTTRLIDPLNYANPGTPDPLDLSFRKLDFPEVTEPMAQTPLLTQVDGEVLILSKKITGRHPLGYQEYAPVAQVYSPNGAGGSFRSTENLPTYDGLNPIQHIGIVTGTSPQNAKVLLVGGSSAGADIYDPRTNLWKTLEACTPPPLVPLPTSPPPRCHGVAALSDGKVLVRESISNDRLDWGGNTRKTFIFDPVAETWSPTGDTSFSESGMDGILLTGSGCGIHCGQILMAGNKKAELYTP